MKTKKELEELVEGLQSQYQSYHSIKSYDVEGNEEEGYYVSIGLVKVQHSLSTSAQYSYLAGMPNAHWRANGTIRNASKAAVSACIEITKNNPDVEFWFYRY